MVVGSTAALSTLEYEPGLVKHDVVAALEQAPTPRPRAPAARASAVYDQIATAAASSVSSSAKTAATRASRTGRGPRTWISGLCASATAIRAAPDVAMAAAWRGVGREMVRACWPVDIRSGIDRLRARGRGGEARGGGGRARAGWSRRAGARPARRLKTNSAAAPGQAGAGRGGAHRLTSTTGTLAAAVLPKTPAAPRMPAAVWFPAMPYTFPKAALVYSS